MLVMQSRKGQLWLPNGLLINDIEAYLNIAVFVPVPRADHIRSLSETDYGVHAPITVLGKQIKSLLIYLAVYLIFI